MFTVIKNFLVQNYKTIFIVAVGLFILYWLIFFLTPKIQMSAQSKDKIDSLNTLIKKIENDQKKLDSNISQFNNQINKLDNNITNLKLQKNIIKEIYHEEINHASYYTVDELDSFFTNRYGFNPR